MRLKSYTKTIRALDYPSPHTFYDWVEKRSSKNPNTNQHRSSKFYLWTLMLEAVTRAASGESIYDIVQELKIVNYALAFINSCATGESAG